MGSIEDATPKFSWHWLEQGVDPRLGPISREYGLMHDPEAMANASVILPQSWLSLWKDLPVYFIQKQIQSLFQDGMDTLDVDAIYAECENDAFSFMKTKSIVFCIAQACIDSSREIAQEMPEPDPLPEQLQSALDRFAELCQCPSYCTLADMSLTASVLLDKETDVLNCTFNHFKLICPVNNAPSSDEMARGDYESAHTRGVAENRFHNTPTMMEFRVSDLVDIIADTQRMIYDYEHTPSEAKREELVNDLLHQVGRAKESFKRLLKGFALLSRKTVDPVVWHRDIVKYTSGYGGHLGLSGPQTPCVHVIDAFLGRASYDTEMGATTRKTFQQMQRNHQGFTKSVAEGPQLRNFAKQLSVQHDDHRLASAFNDLVDCYTKGFLAMHKGRAIEFAKIGFVEAGPREFTAETEYEWPSAENVVSKLRKFFDDAIGERDAIKLDGCFKTELC